MRNYDNYENTCLKGRVKQTQGQLKKHYTQMSTKELKTLSKAILETNLFHISNHLNEKDNHINNDTIKMLLSQDSAIDNILEYNIVPIYVDGTYYVDKRVVLRSKRVEKVNMNGRLEKCNLIFVISLINRTIVTAYYNKVSDNHKSINMSRYCANLKVSL